MSTTPTTPLMGTTPIMPRVRIDTLDGTPATTQIYYNGFPMRSEIKLIRVFHHTADKAKIAKMAVLVEVPLGVHPVSGETIVTEMAVDLLGQKVKPDEIDYLFGPGAYIGTPLSTDDGTGDWEESTPTATPMPTEGPVEDDYHYPTGPIELSIAPYSFAVTNRLSYVHEDFFSYDDAIWNKTGNMSHSTTSKALVSMGTGSAELLMSVPNTDFEAILDFTNGNEITSSSFEFDNANYEVWIKDEDTHFNIRMVHPETQEVYDSDNVYKGDQIIFYRHGSNLILVSVDGTSRSMHYYKDMFNASPLTKFTWNSKDGSGIRQELTEIQVNTVVINNTDYDLMTTFEIQSDPDLETDFTI